MRSTIAQKPQSFVSFVAVLGQQSETFMPAGYRASSDTKLGEGGDWWWKEWFFVVEEEECFMEGDEDWGDSVMIPFVGWTEWEECEND